jgi:hypothetical protein
MECVKLANQIIQLRYSIRNLRIALGMQPGESIGSINYVDEDFVSGGGQLRRVAL